MYEDLEYPMPDNIPLYPICIQASEIPICRYLCRSIQYLPKVSSNPWMGIEVTTASFQSSKTFLTPAGRVEMVEVVVGTSHCIGI